jgi:hypothetical protein
VAFGRPKLRLLKLSCAAFAGAGLGVDPFGFCADRDAIWAAPKGDCDGDGRKGGYAGLTTIGFGFGLLADASEDQSSPERSSMARVLVCWLLSLSADVTHSQAMDDAS